MKFIHNIIDKVPELPYFIVAMVVVLNNPDSGYIHVFSTAFLFMLLSLSVGTALKFIFKTKRPTNTYNYYAIPVWGHEFPSLHSMISIGAIAFVYFVDKWIALILVPVGLFYLYSRVAIKVHRVISVISGAIIGLITGIISGHYLLNYHFSSNLELSFMVLFFVIPPMCSFCRIRYLK